MRIAKITVIQKAEYYTISVRKTIDFMKEYNDEFLDALQKIEAYLKEQGEFISSPPFTCFHNRDLETLDIEMGYEIATKLDDCDTIKINKLPSQKMVMTIDQGDYMKQDPTLMELLDWVNKSEYEETGPIYYYYLNDPDRPAEELLTEMVIAIQ
ncbi:GyrI-like domain-containing protein [Breznakia pachnodae]|uniref:Effector-binding domain-containing protein n=1 Tax=Breznakia pachnodae TaxID=265178 RepID=A0ABU0DZH6_9FIRM|nr:GyrI-like domain-containing protein [Breznakia pachnodae]MDQ0359888.1 effector-binding domain-containing protein [Breznakia pachnodae]